VYLVHSLAAALDKLKLGLKAKVSAGTATDLEQQEYNVLEHSMSKHFVLYVVGRLAEELLGTKVPDLKKWIGKDSIVRPDPSRATDAWTSVLDAIMPLLAVQVKELGTPMMLLAPKIDYEGRRQDEGHCHSIQEADRRAIEANTRSH